MSGLGKARPEVSTTMWSGFGSRASSAVIAGAKSSATVQQMQPLASSMIASSRAGRVGAALDKIAVDPDVAEFVDDEREPPPAGIGEEMADQRRLAGAEKAGDDGDGRLGEHAGASLSERSSASASGGVRDTTPLRKASGRSRQGTMPVGRGGVAARGDDDVLEMRVALEVADDIGPFARRGERDRARPLADGEAFDGLERDIGLGGETRAQAPRTGPAPIGPSSDLQVTQTSKVAAENGRCRRSWRCQSQPGEQWARREIGSLSG